MKYIYSIVLLALCLSTRAQVFIGGKAGISLPDLKGNNEQSKEYTSTVGVNGGLFVNFPLTSSLSLQPELNFSPQGGQRKGMQSVPADNISDITLPAGVILYANFKNITILNYLEIPLVAKLVLGNRIKYYICAGPQVDFLVEAKTKTSGNSLLYFDQAGTMPLAQNGEPLPAVSFDKTTNIKESIKKVNAGFQGGAGIQYPAGPGIIFLEARAIVGCINIQTHPETDGRNKTGALAISAGYMIKLK